MSSKVTAMIAMNGQEPLSGRGLRTWLVGQFGHPRGFWGRLAGRIMATRPSNRRRNRWTVDLLDMKPGQRVLEVGFGPGLALQRAAALIGEDGMVAGIDRSGEMLEQASHCNAASIAAGRMDLRVALVEAMPDFGVRFDSILAVNTIGFWPHPAARLRELRDRLLPGGRIAITVQPRSRGATRATAGAIGARIERELLAAGFESVTTHWLEIAPPAVCVIGVRPPTAP